MVYKIKKRNGEIDRFKCRLVARGFTQVHCVDYVDTHAATAHPTVIRTIFAVAECLQIIWESDQYWPKYS
eukprot:3936540-Rhodomonas_salina.2